MDYIFGYGSLIERASRMRTTAVEQALPYKALGFRRGWFARIPASALTTTGPSPTYLGCVADVASVTNGVVYKVSEQELYATDVREPGYMRVQISADSLQAYADTIPSGVRVWIYIQQFEDRAQLDASLPTKTFPIVQSYVDICVAGCLEIEEEFDAAAGYFIADFFALTENWSHAWVNDRIFPHRPFVHQPHAPAIDLAMERYLPEQIDVRQVLRQFL